MPAPKTERLTIQGPVGELEAELFLPNEARQGAAALVLHPHPLFHGSMTNKVVTTLCRAYADLGIPALRFNFRGVGASEGVHDEGIGEQDDAAAAAQWLADKWPDNELLLAGFSFGAATAIRCSEQLQPAQLISCGVPARYFDHETPTVDCPWLAIHGEADEVAPWAEANSWLSNHPERPLIESKPEVGHFFHGELGWLRDTVKAFVTRSLPA